MKKAMSMVLVCAMILSLMHFPVLADEVTVAPEKGLEQRREVAQEDLAQMEEEQKTNRFIIKPKEEMVPYRTMGVDSDEIGLEPLGVGENQPNGYFLLELDENVDPEAFMAEVADSVDFIQPDYPMELSSISGVEGMEEYFLPEAQILPDWEQNLIAAHEVSTGVGVTVAVIDTGIDLTHPDLLGRFEPGWDFVDDSAVITANENGIDDHGTHVTGIIANVAPDAKIIPLRVFDNNGRAFTSDIIEAIEYAEMHGATIVNCSWGSWEENQALKDTIENSNMLFVAAAGNNRSNVAKTPFFPAAYDLENIISVAAINDDGGMSYFSNYGEEIDIAAWGKEILSTIPGGGYKKMTGTSMSSAFVAGAAALVIDANKTSIEETKEIIQKCGDQVEALKGKVAQGRILNFFKAVNCIESSEIFEVDVYDDFDVFKKPTESESLRLFSLGQIKQVATGRSHTIILMTDGTVWSWGDNTYSQLGYTLEPEEYDIFDETEKKKATIRPRQVPGLTDIKYIAAGYDTSMAVKNDGTVYGWGYNRYGGLSTGYLTKDSTLPTISKISNVEHIVLEDDYTLFVKEDQTIWVSGFNFFGFSTVTQPFRRIYVAEKVNLISDDGSRSSTVLEIAATDSHLAILYRINYRNGVSVWLRDSLAEPNMTNPRWIVDSGAKSIAAIGLMDTYILSSNGTKITRWYGHKERTSWTTKPVRKLEGKGDTLILLYEDGTVGSLGKNELGQLGNTTNADSLYEFTSVMTTDDSAYIDLSNIEMVSTFGTHSVALNQNGELYSWGLNDNGQLGNTLVDHCNYARKNESSIVEAIPTEPVSIGYGLPASKLTLPKQVTAKLDNDTNIILDVSWHTEEYNAELAGSAQIISGEFVDNVLMVKNPNNVIPTVTVNVEPPKTVTSVEVIQPISLKYGKLWEDAYSNGKIKTQAEITFDDNTKITLPIIWESSSFQPCYFEQTQEIIGTFETCYSTAYIGIENHLLTLVIEIQPPELTKLEAGMNYSLMLKEDGTVWAWGNNSYGQLGDGTTTRSLVPQKIPGLEDIKDISAGYYHNLALDSDGVVWEWGKNIGNVPVQVNIEKPATDISAGLDFSMVCAEGIYTWGVNNKGQLGNGQSGTGYFSTPTLVMSCKKGKTPQKISAGKYHALVCTKEGELWGWGELDSENEDPELTPQLFMNEIKNAEAGNQISIVEDTNGCMRYAGRWEGAVGPESNPTGGYIYDPTKPLGYVLQWKKASCGDSVNLIYGDWVWSWGKNNYGQLGNGTTTDSGSLQMVIDGGTKKQVYANLTAAGGNHALYAQAQDIGPNNRWFAYACGDNTYGQLGDGTTISSRYAIEVGKPRQVVSVEKKTIHVDFDTPETALELPGYLSVAINGGVSRLMPVIWDTSAYDGTKGGTTQELPGTLTLPTGVENPLEDKVTISIEVGNNPATTIISVQKPEEVKVRYNTPAEDLPLPDSINVTLGSEMSISIPVTWDTTAYDPLLTLEPQEITGTFVLPEGITNPDNIPPKVDVVVDIWRAIIVSIEPRSLEARQNVLLGPTDKVHDSGMEPTVEILPESTVAYLEDGNRAVLPVLWDVDKYDRMLPEIQSFTGSVVIDEQEPISNPNEILAELSIDVMPRIYEVYPDFDPLPTVSIEVLLGTPISELNNVLLQEGKSEVSICAYDIEDDFNNVYLFCDITLTEEKNSGYNMDVPGEYPLVASLPENVLIDGVTNDLPIMVTVLEPSEAVSIEPIYIEARQSVAPKYMENIPTQAKVMLENGKVAMADVEWDWDGYDENDLGITRGAVQKEIVGTLKNIPAAIKQPISLPLEVRMQVEVIPTEYTVTGIENNSYIGEAGLTLEELSAKISPMATLNITCSDGEGSFDTKYDVPITLQEEGSTFDPKQAKECMFAGSLIEIGELPANITWPTWLEKTATLTTTKVTAEEPELLYAEAGEGTPFSEVSLPAQVMVTLSCQTADGVHKTAFVDVDWGSGEGYTPTPESWNEDGTATLMVTGSLAGCEGYISNIGDVSVSVEITIMPVRNILSVTPDLFPVSGVLEVPVGSTLDEIYAKLADAHTVQLTLQDSRGNTYTEEKTYLLREEDNPDYDPAVPGTYRLNAYLPLGGTIKNPDGVKVEILVITVKYTIYAVETIKISHTTGDDFEDLELPDEVTITRNDKVKEKLGVTWNSTNYNPNKIGGQVIQGTLNTPLPVYLENPQNRQPRILLTLTDPSVQILSLTPMAEASVMMITDIEPEIEEVLPGIVEYRFWAELLHEDGSITIEPYSIFEEISEQ